MASLLVSGSGIFCLCDRRERRGMGLGQMAGSKWLDGKKVVKFGRGLEEKRVASFYTRTSKHQQDGSPSIISPQQPPFAVLPESSNIFAPPARSKSPITTHRVTPLLHTTGLMQSPARWSPPRHATNQTQFEIRKMNPMRPSNGAAPH